MCRGKSKVVEAAEAVDEATMTTIVAAATGSRRTSILTARPKHLQAALMTPTRNVSILFRLDARPFANKNRWRIPELCCLVVPILDVPAATGRLRLAGGWSTRSWVLVMSHALCTITH